MSESEASNDLVTIDRQGNGVALVSLNRPEKYNALSPEMFTAIVAAGEALAADTSVRAVVLKGNGKGFCAGLDLTTFQKVQADGGEVFRSGLGQYPNLFQNVAWIWKKLPVPVIAALQGVAFGGGLQIALGADIRIAHPQAQLSVMEIKWGLIPDMSGTQTLRELVGIDVAKMLTFTGQIITAEEGARLGLVTRLADDPIAAALEMADSIAQKSPDAIVAGKRLFESAWHGDAQAGLKLEETEQFNLMGKPNQVEAILSNMQKRAPDFADRKGEDGNT